MSRGSAMSRTARRPFLSSPSRPRLGGLRLASLLAALALSWGCGATLPVDPVVSIAPAAVTLQAGGGSQQFTATVLNAANTSVVWKVNGRLGGNAATGTVSQTGLYQAPAAVPAGPVAVEAVSVANANFQAAAAITLTAAVGLTIAPASATVDAGASLQFTATVANATDTAVTWSVNGVAGGAAATGTISASGLYTAPTSFPGLSQVTIGAASTQDPAVTATATVTLAQPVAVSVAPASATINVGASLGFTATVTGSGNPAVSWSVNGVAGGNATLGTITAQGVFTAPTAVPAPALETVTATSAADPSKSATAAVTITAPISITL